MKITRIEVHQLDVPMPGGVYRLSGGRSFTAFDVTIVAVHTSADISGWGELGVLGANYLPAFGGGARAAIGELAPALLGESPLQLDRLNWTMDRVLAGHLYAKSAIDIACWDILGKCAEMPICDLMGGRFGGPMDLLSAIPTDAPAQMAEAVARYRDRGYRRHSIKLGGAPNEDIARICAVMAEALPEEEVQADCNCGWTVDQALRVMRDVRGLEVTFEQPCASYQECLALRRRADQPIVLDEIIDGVEIMLRVVQDRAADMINIKISRVGGLTRARRVREICIAGGLPVSLQDTAGGSLTQAAVLHLAQSTPERLRHSLYNPLDYCRHALAENGLTARGGRLEAPNGPGLGVAPPASEVLGEPVAVYS